MNISSNLLPRLREILFILSVNAIFLLPQQFSKDLYLNGPFWIVLLVSCSLLPLIYTGVKEIKNSRVGIVLFLYLLMLGITVQFSTDKYISRAILFLNIAYFLLFLGSSKVLVSFKSRKIFGLVYLVVIALLSVISYYNTVKKGYVNLTSEGLSFYWGYFGHNHLAVLLIVAIPLCLYFLCFRKGKFAKFLIGSLLMFFLYSLLISFSRAAIFSLLIALILGVILFSNFLKEKLSLKVVIVLGVVIILLVLSMAIIWERKSLRSINIRAVHFQKGIEMFMQKPVAGFGVGTFGEVKMPYQYTRQNAFFAHNLVVQSMAEGGIILLVSTIGLFSILIIEMIKIIRLLKTNDRYFFYAALWVGIVGVLINEMMDFDLQLPAVGGLFWILSGLICFCGSNEN